MNRPLHRMRWLAVVVAGVSVLGTAHVQVQAASKGPTVTDQITLSGYRIVFVVGPAQTMYTPAQVKMQHPKSGELYLAGAMPTSMGMGMMGTAGMRNIHHVEIHIYNARTGRVVTPPPSQVRITLRGGPHKAGTAAPLLTVPVMEMRGIGQGVQDTHYGNNVTIVKASYHLEVQATVGNGVRLRAWMDFVWDGTSQTGM